MMIKGDAYDYLQTVQHQIGKETPATRRLNALPCLRSDLLESRRGESREKWEMTLDYNADHFCPIYGRIIDSDLCYGTIGVLNRWMPPDDIPELIHVIHLDPLQAKCNECLYSDLGGGT